MVKRKYIAFALIVVALFLLLRMGWNFLWPAEGRARCPGPAPRKVCDYCRTAFEMPGHNPSAAESNEIARAFLRVVEAYTNGNLSVLRRRMAEVPPLATNVTSFTYIELIRPFLCSLDDGFLSPREMRDFEDTEEFTEFMRLNVEAARFLGDLNLRRGAYSGSLIRLDKCVLRRLVQYRDRFRRENRRDMEARAEEFIAEWEALIESPGGYTRNYMRMQLALQHGHIDEGSGTQEQLIQFARQFATGLIKAGYTPKWLDEEFPLPDGEKANEQNGKEE